LFVFNFLLIGFSFLCYSSNTRVYSGNIKKREFLLPSIARAFY
jgi:hypothetical protein